MKWSQDIDKISSIDGLPRRKSSKRFDSLNIQRRSKQILFSKSLPQSLEILRLEMSIKRSLVLVFNVSVSGNSLEISLLTSLLDNDSIYTILTPNLFKDLVFRLPEVISEVINVGGNG